LTPLYSLQDVGMRYDSVAVLAQVNLEFPAAQMAAIVGPNGAGKSTLLGVMSGLRHGYTGYCAYNGVEVGGWQRRGFARHVSVVPQSLRLEFPFTAEQVVMMGRTPFCDGLFESPEDRDAVDRAMEITDTATFRKRDFRSLSGGERQLVILASALAQSPRTLLLDEPTTFLDLKHQVSIYRLLRDLREQGLLVVAVTHDLNLAAAYSDRVVMLKSGRIAADGVPGETLRSDVIRDVFDVQSQVREAADGRPWIVYGH
jgi:iron complex transport system ATP-binding protein